jgi:hypothetical protein
MKMNNINTKEVAALKAGVDRKTARKYLKEGELPSELKQIRHWKTKPDIFESAWPILEAMLKNNAKIEAKTLLAWLMTQEQWKDIFKENHLRTLQRRVRDWQALYGPEKEVMFCQDIQPGRQSQSDYTCMNSIGVFIAGEAFPHLLFHFMLPYSRWEAVMVCYSESFASLTLGYTTAVFELGAVAPEHRTDNLSAATHRIGSDRDFNKDWLEFLGHYGVKPSRNNPGVANENGSVEKSHDLLKKAVDQQLILRGSRNFIALEDYEKFVKGISKSRNCGREVRLAEDLKKFLSLPERRWHSPESISVTVNPTSTITVLKGIYSVPARLIGYGLTVDIYPDSLEIRYGKKVVETLPRLPKGRGVSINYRHIIAYLVRKPGAFAHYQYRECLFPRAIFRKAYDALIKQSPARGHKDYLKVLHLAAITNETDVATALEVLLEANQLPIVETLKELLNLNSKPPIVYVKSPSLLDYDSLLSSFISAPEGSTHAIH